MKSFVTLAIFVTLAGVALAGPKKLRGDITDLTEDCGKLNCIRWKPLKPIKTRQNLLKPIKTR